MNTSTSTHQGAHWPPAVSWLAEAAAGALLGFLLALLGGYAGALGFAQSSNGWSDLIAAVLGALIGYTIGTSIGVYVVGRRAYGRGAYWTALVGSVIGAALVMLLAEPLRLNSSATLLQISLAVAAPVVSVLAFHAGLRRSRSQ